MDFEMNLLKFDAHGLIPAIIQDVNTDEVLMMAYMNKESLQKTLETGRTWFWSRSRKELWNKGATSGHYQEVRTISYDCDADSLLVKAVQTGAACHTGERTCFHNPVLEAAAEDSASAGILNEVYEVIMSRKREMPEGSYTTYLFTKGIDKICKKVGEEAAEVIIGAKNRNREEVIYEVGDLIYHLLVLLGEQGIEPSEVYRELAGRR
ncbi:bifunctional phosphoribosyl-AMP cyclohydrolase/phosphoribosyl-ATP diphosphatase HisIE [Phosphitispora fastidiosa]|uniref:bifunctional phosphoribosyl-AMP cyclohydrolase/phosphoribosyl-ATP diphosphatase HisIE n=1 Tax=Phosphitispora fastidiosa TaxID=2837202 RepID=UPI001E3E7474|nr:bifunctional phosphoribosyl-AMP cyclohydrolase/phosphoribosyl-ATP diphosphatase HisIE [Phosphitispora fastidiosa]MBU7008537.1 phosphoribosyl-ATP pyrophosphohydrolase/phosphoribosyl-AMP cyclohydrolase [Phosphitispora fastidiosa]